MKLIVDYKQRLAKMRAHTATHLLHAFLDKLLWWTRQAWSYVDEDYLRFDFTSDRLLTNQEIKYLEEQVNEVIYKAYEVEIQNMTLDDAKKLWAKAFFEEKYGDIVRVVIVKDDKNNIISAELCGWTHVKNTSQIGSFKIIWQEAVASGIKRIIAVTWPKVVNKCCWELENLVYNLETILDVKSQTQILDKVKKLLKENKDLKDYVTKLEDNLLYWLVKDSINSLDSNKFFDLVLFVEKDKFKDFEFKKVVNIMKQLYWNKKFLVYNENWNFAINLPDGGAKEFIKRFWLRWWGSDNFVQGKDENIKAVIEKLF